MTNFVHLNVQNLKHMLLVLKLTTRTEEIIFFLQNVNGSVEPEEEWTGQLLSERQTVFELRAPSPAPAYLSIHYICESAARLLFLSVHWARGIPAFQALP